MLLNVALHGLEAAAGVRYVASGYHTGRTETDSPVLIRYADDLVVLCHTEHAARQIQARLAEWLAPRGLAFNQDKTRIVHLDEGFDFLGFNVRRYNGKLLIKPSKAAVKRIRSRLSTEFRALRGSNVTAVLVTIVPIVRGWTAYYRGVVSKRTFSSLDMHMWRLAYKWAKHSHPHKSKSWIVRRYFGRFNPARADRWVFGNHDNGAHLLKFAWTPIVRHQMVPGRASPDDPDLALYWARRRSKRLLPVDNTTWRLLRRQRGVCPICATPLLASAEEPDSPREWERWLTTTRRTVVKQFLTTGGHATPGEIRLVHRSCHHKGTTPQWSRKPPDRNPGSPPAACSSRMPR